MAKYLLSAGVITGFGTWQYDPATPEQAIAFVQDGDCISAIGYAETADALETIVERVVEIPVNRVLVDLEPGDQALVIRPVGGFRFDPTMKGNLTTDFVLEHAELGLLTRM
jgi:hypothetical protein